MTFLPHQKLEQETEQISDKRLPETLSVLNEINEKLSKILFYLEYITDDKGVVEDDN